MLVEGTPTCVSIPVTAFARSKESRKLYSRPPTVSVWPETMMSVDPRSWMVC